MEQKINFLQHSHIDKKKWDECIRRSSNGMIYAYSWYLDIVSPGWNALCDENYETVFPLTGKKKYRFNYLCQPLFTQQLGVFSSDNNLSEENVNKFIEAIPSDYRLIEINLNTKNNFHSNDFKISERLTHHLDLDQSYETIYKSYSENLQRNIKRAVKNEIKLTDEADPKEIISLFKKNKGREVNQYSSADYKVLLQLFETASEKKKISFLGAITSNGKLCAGAVFLHSDHEYIFFFSGSDPEARDAGAMSFIIDRFIHNHSGEKSKLDFEGSMDKNLARFYKSFGSKEIVYLQIRKNKLPSYIRWLKK